MTENRPCARDRTGQGHTTGLGHARQGKFCREREFSVMTDLDRAGHDRLFMIAL